MQTTSSALKQDFEQPCESLFTVVHSSDFASRKQSNNCSTIRNQSCVLAVNGAQKQRHAHAVKDYWEDRAQSFGLDGENIDAWGALMQRHIPSTVKLVLDVGCGTGAMTIPLVERGYNVVGLDLCENMIKRAQDNLSVAGLKAKFMQASADELPFAPESVDALVNRNVLSNLVNPEGALHTWCEVLKPGGTLLYFDSAWWHYLYDEHLDSLREAYYGSGSSATFNSLESLAPDLPLSREIRPAWDKQFLEREGMEIVEVRDVSSLVWTSEEQLRYSFAPQFMVVARKPLTNGYQSDSRFGIYSDSFSRSEAFAFN